MDAGKGKKEKMGKEVGGKEERQVRCNSRKSVHRKKGVIEGWYM